MVQATKGAVALRHTRPTQPVLQNLAEDFRHLRGNAHKAKPLGRLSTSSGAASSISTSC